MARRESEDAARLLERLLADRTLREEPFEQACGVLRFPACHVRAPATSASGR